MTLCAELMLDSQGAIDEVVEHLIGVFWLATRDHVASVAHDVHAQVADRLEVPCGVAIPASHHRSVRVVVLINVTPGLHLLEHLEDSRVVTDNIKVP